MKVPGRTRSNLSMVKEHLYYLAMLLIKDLKGFEVFKVALQEACLFVLRCSFSKF